MYFFVFTVSSGGSLLDFCAVHFGKKTWRPYFKGVVLPLTSAEKRHNFQSLNSQMKGEFYGWLLVTLKSRSQKNTSQLFFLSLIDEWRGISARGMDVNGKMGLTLTGRTYRRHKAKALIREKARVMETIQTCSCIFWVDNFNIFFKKSYLALGVGPYVNVDWTPVGISVLPNTSSLQLLHAFLPGTRDVLPCFPEHILNAQCVREILNYASRFDNFKQAFHWRTSVATQYQVFSTPLRLEGVMQTQEEIVYGSNVGLRHFHPVDLLSKNVGRTDGLCGVMRELQRNYWLPGHYMILKVDVDLFWRISLVSFLFLNV